LTTKDTKGTACPEHWERKDKLCELGALGGFLFTTDDTEEFLNHKGHEIIYTTKDAKGTKKFF